ncbi:hypothetical protein AVEN_128505-1 [Araneus ventricosus]|uniref:Uncharacterized protein n=1 Tax=Araneus ventricosus TaxID=182803 RepID=A0A4Y2U7H9_ARAVE|nr:hypothetical protein AVEN_128505-1 [Araneus ventricosus]
MASDGLVVQEIQPGTMDSRFENCDSQISVVMWTPFTLTLCTPERNKMPNYIKHVSRFLGVGFSRRPRAAIGPLAPTIDDCSNSRVSPQFWKPVATLSMS